VWEDGLLAERVSFESEAGIRIPGLLLMPEEWKEPAPFVIYAGEWGKKQGLRSGRIEALVQAGYGVLAVDVRGAGETATSDFEAGTNCLMMDRSLFGQRVYDVIRAVDFLWERCYIAPQIDKGRLTVLGEGVGGVWALHAAALDGRVAAAAAWKTLFSYKALLEPGGRHPASVYLFDVLRQYDLAQVIDAIAPRPVYFLPVDGQRRECAQDRVLSTFMPAREAFSLSGAATDSFKVANAEGVNDLTAWLDTALDRQRNRQESRQGVQS
jgi:dienelactone hydrolase